jgi:hypothetical protein
MRAFFKADREKQIPRARTALGMTTIMVLGKQILGRKTFAE